MNCGTEFGVAALESATAGCSDVLLNCMPMVSIQSAKLFRNWSHDSLK